MTKYNFRKNKIKKNSHWTISTTRLLIEGGTPLDAIQRYAPIWRRDTFEIVKFSPSTTFTVNK